MTEQYRFGRFTLEPAAHRLSADGMRVPLGRTDFRLLLVLLESAGSFVDKEHLVSRVWGRAAVSDSALYFHINALRKALGSDSIVTRQGRGYRFAAQIARNSADAASQQDVARSGLHFVPLTSDTSGGPTRLIGRMSELRTATDLLAQSRLVTLTGPGGVGKTRLAAAIAGNASVQFADGVRLVELVALNDGALVQSAAATALGARPDGDAKLLARHLERKSLLVVLDNCEHVIDAAADLCEGLLGAAPNLKILATSREPLSCAGEQVLEVPPFDVSRAETISLAELRKADAIELFAERAKSIDLRFHMDDADTHIVARICRRVDGLPLAIEMAAGWVDVLGLARLEAKLDGSMKDWLRSGRTTTARHSTMRATLEWSHNLLSAEEQTVLRRLAVFAGSFAMEAAECVAQDDVVSEERVFEHVASLIRKSMIVLVPGPSGPRYRLLETTRTFMLEKLATSPECAAQWCKHAAYVLHAFETAKDDWETMNANAWTGRYAALLDDLRGALDWTMRENPSDAVALAGASWPLWRELCLRVEGRKWLSAAVTRLNADTPPGLEAQLRHGLGEMWPSHQAACAEFARAATLYRSLGESGRLGGALARLGFALLMSGRIGEAQPVVEESLSLLTHTPWTRMLATAYSAKSCVEARLNHFEAARRAAGKALSLCELIGAPRMAFAISANLIEMSLESADLDGAIALGRSLTNRLRDTPHSDLRGFALGLLCAALTARGDIDEALAVAREAAPLLRDDGALPWLFDHLALRAGLARRMTDAALLAGYADAACQTLGHVREPVGRNAVEHLSRLLRDSLPDDDIAELSRIGAQLSEDQAMTLAFGG